jgi:hypothetical protein
VEKNLKNGPSERFFLLNLVLDVNETVRMRQLGQDMKERIARKAQPEEDSLQHGTADFEPA